eukprot:766975-Rhodomonas_salina.2
MGAGVTYRKGDCTDTPLSATGILSTFAAEAAGLKHLLATTDTTTPLTALLDTLTVLQNIKKCLDPPCKYDPTTHDHKD